MRFAVSKISGPNDSHYNFFLCWNSLWISQKSLGIYNSNHAFGFDFISFFLLLQILIIFLLLLFCIFNKFVLIVWVFYSLMRMPYAFSAYLFSSHVGIKNEFIIFHIHYILLSIFTRLISASYCKTSLEMKWKKTATAQFSDCFRTWMWMWIWFNLWWILFPLISF